ncbi:hypothetical protein [Gordonia aichiensis]|uniref:hypothetical protein n=1 Tax=Gordonia aichiensis TaxID=36820 RepID=UPI003266BAA1
MQYVPTFFFAFGTLLLVSAGVLVQTGKRDSKTAMNMRFMVVFAILAYILGGGFWMLGS